MIFPEAQFPPPRYLAPRYRESVERGYARMKDRTAVVAGLARDLGDRLPHATASIDAIGGLFGDYRVVLYENDSRDGTPDRLRDWLRPQDYLRSETRHLPKWASIRHPDRGAQMAAYREQLRQDIVEHGGAADVVLILDTDIAAFSLDGIAHTLGQDDWDVVGSLGLKEIKGRTVNYDVWAWRDVNHPDPHNRWQINPRTAPRGAALQPVWSCFGGLAIYRAATMRAAGYSGDNGGDHYRFHFGLREAGLGRIFCNPSQITLYG